MEGLELNSIPIRLLARIMIQLLTLPPNKNNSDLLSMITAGLKVYGQTSDLNAFLEYCKTGLSIEAWSWQHYTITSKTDWEDANHKKDHEVVGLRFLIHSETERRRIQLTRWSKSHQHNPKCVQFYQGRAMPIDHLLNDTLHYLQKAIPPALEDLIQLRLERFREDTLAFEQQSRQLDHADYDLVGALMVRYDSTANRGYASDAWCLYLRDFIETSDGSVWRILCDEQDQKITSDQAMADIRGLTTTDQTIQPTDFSKAYRPVYVFYVNLALLQAEQSQGITLEDYTLEEEEESIPCMHCGIKEIADDINDIFFCESCHQGVHQLCEDPPIQSFELKIDPWYCRTCCRNKNLPIPILEDTFLSHKRKREEEEE